MNSIVVTVERSVFPLTRFFITIGENDFNLRPGEIKKIKLPKSDVYEITASSYWLKKNVNLHLDNDSVVKIKHGISDIFYLIGVPIIVILSILGFFGIFNVNLLSVILLIYFLPILYVTFLKRNNYFKILKENDS